ncbi:hypothetical protein KFK09_000886 [Dendrobium nobile]|uniref:Uncharacterized protein n=1 Tax=Dendrobium nobile TaxID=94219 RepID=A0A8T3CG20_DENNO|nr:hypothetical protein KFK09_000886 [Dendrobium nobile]
MARAIGHAIAAITTKISGNARTSGDAGTSVAVCIIGERGPATSAPPLLVGKREGLSACFTTVTLSLASPSLAAIQEADNYDDELLEKVKIDRKKRLQRHACILFSLACFHEILL